MTRSEFKEIVLAYALIPSSVPGETFEPVSGGQTLAEWCIEFGKGEKYANVYRAIAEVITNGLEPEPVRGLIFTGRLITHGIDPEYPTLADLGPSFIGSHNLPHDTDWD